MRVDELGSTTVVGAHETQQVHPGDAGERDIAEHEDEGLRRQRLAGDDAIRCVRDLEPALGEHPRECARQLDLVLHEEQLRRRRRRCRGWREEWLGGLLRGYR